MAYQRVQVGVAVEDGELVIVDAMTGEEIARHSVSTDKGQILKNNNHYRDLSQTIARHESDLLATLGDDLGQRLCRCLQVAFPDNYKDQLVGLKSILKQHQPLNLELLEVLSERSSVSARQVRTFLEAYQNNPERLLAVDDDAGCSAAISQALTAYGNLSTSEGGCCHEHD
jgi:hypothetical protein